jgi:gliding motility-associated lipoprotein GldH
MEKNEWHYSNIITYEFDITDTINSNNISLFMRTDLDYSYRNIYLIISLFNDNLTILTDTVQYTIADQYGRWTGNGIGDIKSNYLRLNDVVTFPGKGIYYFSIKHGMRDVSLRGVRRVGLEIKKNK